MNNIDFFLLKIYLFISKRKKVTMTDSNEIMKMEDKDKERLYHETVQNEALLQRCFLEAKKI